MNKQLSWINLNSILTGSIIGWRFGNSTMILTDAPNGEGGVQDRIAPQRHPS